MGLKKRVERRQGKVDAARASFGTDNVDQGFDRKLKRLKKSVAKAEKQGINVDYDTTNASGEGRSRTTVSTSGSPAKMAYKETSPAKNLNKGYGSEMESPKQERKNLMNDNPIASRASGGSWMSKHSQSMGSPMKMMKDSPMETSGAREKHGHHMQIGSDNSGVAKGARTDTPSEYWRKHQLHSSHHKSQKPASDPASAPAQMKDSPMEKELVGKQKNLPEALKAKIEAAPEMRYKK